MDGLAADPAANREAAASRPVAERPRDRTANNPAPERPVADRPVTARSAGDRPENGGAADTPPVRDTRDGAADADALQAENAALRKELADSKSELQAEKVRSAELETQLTAEKARNADLTNQVTDRDTKLAEQDSDIGALKEKAEKHDGVLADLLERVANVEREKPDAQAGDRERADTRRPEVREASDGARDGTQDQSLDWLEDRAVGDDVRNNRKSLTEKARHVAGTATDAALAGAGLAGPYLTLVGADAPATYAGGGVTAAGFIWAVAKVVVKWRKVRNGD